MTTPGRDIGMDESPVGGRRETTDPERGDSARKGGFGRLKGIASLVGGAALLVLGLRRRGLRGAVMALAGGALFYRGAKKKNPLEAIRTSEPEGSQDSHAPETETGPTEVRQTVTIDESPDELYERWRDPETHEQVFGEFVEVSSYAEDRQRWTVNGPRGWSTTWDVRFVEDRPGEVLRWATTDTSSLFGEGSIEFRPAPADRGTEVTLRLEFDPPGGRLGERVVDRLGLVPEAFADKTLRRFKSLVETGEVPTLAKNPSGRGTGDLL